MAFFKKLKERLFKSSSKIDEGLDAIVEDGGAEETGDIESDHDAIEIHGAPLPERETVPETPPEPLAEPQPEPLPEPEPEPEPDPKTQPEPVRPPDPEPLPEPEPILPAPDAEPLVAPEPDIAPEPELDPDPVSEPIQEPAPEPEPEPAPQSGPISEPETTPAPERETATQPGLLGRLLGRKETKVVMRRALDDDMLEQLEELLITADMGVDTALRVTANMAEGRMGKKLSTREIKELM
ncbi:MAG: signal recognition particle receptor subunit alpha, partial [Pseudomonadota bacterium]